LTVYGLHSVTYETLCNPHRAICTTTVHQSNAYITVFQKKKTAPNKKQFENLLAVTSLVYC